MMKNTIIIITSITLCFISACATTEVLPDKTINQSYVNLNFLPEESKSEIADGLVLTVEPIDAAILNRSTLVAASRSGNYERETVNAYFSQNYRAEGLNSELSGSERRHMERIREMATEISSDINSGDLSEGLGNALLERIWYGSSAGLDGSEIYSLKGTSSSSPRYNPYHISGRYLSVIKLTFKNSSNEVNYVDFDDFQVSSGNEMLFPVTINYLERLFSGNDVKTENAYRFNLPPRMKIVPGQKVVKYIAVPAINDNETNLSVQYFGDGGEVIDYKFELDKIREDYEIRYKNFLIEPVLTGDERRTSVYDFYYAVKLENNSTFAVRDNNFYIPQEEMGQKIIICGVKIPQTGSRASYNHYSCYEYNLSEHRGRRIVIQLGEKDE